MNLSYRIYYVWKRNLVSYKRFIIPTVLVSFGEPLFYLIAMGVGLGAYIGLFGGGSYLSYLVPGILVMSAMMSSTFECLYGSFVRMIHEKTYDALIVTPISAEDVTAGDIVWGIFRGLISGFLMLFVATLLGAIPISLVIVMETLALLVLVGFFFSSAAMIITSFAPNFDFFNYYTELVITPMFFFSGVFFPLDKMPDIVKAIANFIPLSHAVALSRAIFSGEFTPGLIINILALIIPGTLLFLVAIALMKKRLIK